MLSKKFVVFLSVVFFFTLFGSPALAQGPERIQVSLNPGQSMDLGNGVSIENQSSSTFSRQLFLGETLRQLGSIPTEYRLEILIIDQNRTALSGNWGVALLPLELVELPAGVTINPETNIDPPGIDGSARVILSREIYKDEFDRVLVHELTHLEDGFKNPGYAIVTDNRAMEAENDRKAREKLARLLEGKSSVLPVASPIPTATVLPTIDFDAEEIAFENLPFLVDQRQLVPTAGNSSVPMTGHVGILWHQIAIGTPGVTRVETEPGGCDGICLVQKEVTALGSAQPGYHVVVGTKEVEGGYAEAYWVQDLNARAWHAGSSYNPAYLAVSYVDVPTEAPPTPAQLKTMKLITKIWMRDYGISALDVQGHKEVSTVRADPIGVDMDEIRKELDDAGFFQKIGRVPARAVSSAVTKIQEIPDKVKEVVLALVPKALFIFPKMQTKGSFLPILLTIILSVTAIQRIQISRLQKTLRYGLKRPPVIQFAGKFWILAFLLLIAKIATHDILIWELTKISFLVAIIQGQLESWDNSRKKYGLKRFLPIWLWEPIHLLGVLTVLSVLVGMILGLSFNSEYIQNLTHSLEIPKISVVSGTDTAPNGSFQMKYWNGSEVTISVPAGFWIDAVDGAKKYGGDPRLVFAVCQSEGSNLSDATSPSGASGICQIMPGTWDWQSCSGNIRNDRDNTICAAKFAKFLELPDQTTEDNFVARFLGTDGGSAWNTPDTDGSKQDPAVRQAHYVWRLWQELKRR